MGQPVRQKPTEDAADEPGELRDRGEKPGLRNAHVADALEIIRQPRHIEPGDADGPELAADPRPGRWDREEGFPDRRTRLRLARKFAGPDGGDILCRDTGRVGMSIVQ